MSYPVYLDLEEAGTQEGVVERAIVFGDIIEKAGYWCGIYANLYWWEVILKKGLERFTKWVAQYYTKCEYTGSNLDIWQYSSKGEVDGIAGGVDMNECYRDFPAEIRGKVSTAPVETPVVKPVTPAPVEKEEKGKVDPADSFNKAKAGTYKVNTYSGLNLRSGASTNKDILETMANGTKVKCYGYYTGEWLYVVSASGKTGFCHSDYLKKV